MQSYNDLDPVARIFFDTRNIRKLTDQLTGPWDRCSYMALNDQMQLALARYPSMIQPQFFASQAAYIDAVIEHVELLNEFTVAQFRHNVAAGRALNAYYLQYELANNRPLPPGPVSSYTPQQKVKGNQVVLTNALRFWND